MLGYKQKCSIPLIFDFCIGSNRQISTFSDCILKKKKTVLNVFFLFLQPTDLNCTHAFCHGCIESWTRIKNICPLCRASVTNKTYCRSLDTFLDKITSLLSKDSQSKRQKRIEDYNLTHK